MCLSLSLQVRADDKTPADVLIGTQKKLLDLRAARVLELDSENVRLEKALLEMKDLNDKNVSRQLTYGAIGVALGVGLAVLANGLLAGKK
jgi:hypothetical protein